jgi:hypothetical protein
MEIQYQNRLYPSLARLAELHGLKPELVRRRLKMGCSLELALQPMSLRATPSRDHKGRTYKTLTKMLQAWNVPAGNYFWRLRHGWTIEEALTGSRDHRKREWRKRHKAEAKDET